MLYSLNCNGQSGLSRWPPSLWALAFGAVVAACSQTTEEPPLDPPDQLGPFGVGHRTFTAVDAKRQDRSLAVDLWYPVDRDQWQSTPRTSYALTPIFGLDSEVAAEGLPLSRRSNQSLLVFSHGYGGINTQSVDLMETLASHGFVVASPEHTGNSQSSMTDSFDEAAAHRVPDVSFVIDTMLARTRDPDDPWHGRLDERRVGVVGHSFGGMTAIGMAAGWAGAGPDERVAAIVPISAVVDSQLRDDDRRGPNAGFTETQLAGIDIPVLLLGGTEDEDVSIANNDVAFEQMSRAPWLYQVDIIGANHTHFANVCALGDLLIEDLGLGPESWPALGAEELVDPYQATCGEGAFPISEAIRLQNLFVVSFFKRHLSNVAGYGGYLSAEYAAQEPAVELSVRHRRP